MIDFSHRLVSICSPLAGRWCWGDETKRNDTHECKTPQHLSPNTNRNRRKLNQTSNFKSVGFVAKLWRHFRKPDFQVRWIVASLHTPSSTRRHFEPIKQSTVNHNRKTHEWLSFCIQTVCHVLSSNRHQRLGAGDQGWADRGNVLLYLSGMSWCI